MSNLELPFAETFGETFPNFWPIFCANPIHESVVTALESLEG